MKATTTILTIIALSAGTATSAHAQTTLFGDRERNSSSSTTNRPHYTRPPAQQQNNDESTDADKPKESPLRKEFNNIRELQKVAYEKAMERKNKADAAAIEGLKRRVGVKDIDFATRCDKAIEAVNKSKVFYAYSRDVRRRTENEASLWNIKKSRDQVIKSLCKQVLGNAKPHYQTLQKKAFDAKDYDLAKEIEEALKAFGRGELFLGIWAYNDEAFHLFQNAHGELFLEWIAGVADDGWQKKCEVQGRIIKVEDGWALELLDNGKTFVEKIGSPWKRWVKIN